MKIHDVDSDIYPYKTVIYLYESNIPIDIIALQLDLDVIEVENIVKGYHNAIKQKVKSAVLTSSIANRGMLRIDPLFNIDSAVNDAQKRTWYQLKVKSGFNLSQEHSQQALEKFAGKSIRLVILHVDLVGSTDLSMNLPLHQLVPIIQAFTQEMSLIIEAYGGYVFKYVGDAIMAFFFTSEDEHQVPCMNSVSCARSMVKIINDGMNSILEQNGYPELGIRIGIDIGENMIAQYGLRPDITISISDPTRNRNGTSNLLDLDSDASNFDENQRIATIKKPCLDIIGYTANIASKMTNYARPNRMVIGEQVYLGVDAETKRQFRKLDTSNSGWKYVNDSTGRIYELYENME